MLAEKKIEPIRDQFFEIRISSVGTGNALTFDIYLMVANKPVLFRKRGDVITPERMKLLFNHGGEKFLVPEDHRKEYLSSMRTVIRDPSTSTDDKAKFIKESAFLHVQDLFTKDNISPVVVEASSLVEEMVDFVSTDIDAVSSLLRLSVHDYYTYNHCVDVAVYSIVLAKRLFGDSKEHLMVAGLGGLLHDIGKRKINTGIINKSSALTPEEWSEIKKHPQYGIEFIEGIPSIPDSSRLIVFEHHENFDGTGYPRGLKGEEISKLARIVTIADVFDALTTNRSYHKAVRPGQALNIMYGMQPGKFDPGIFRSFDKNFANKKPPVVLPPNFDPCKPPGNK